MRFRATLSAIVLSVGAVVTTLPAAAATNVVYILDASNSMWGQIDGTPKIETAREVMTDLLGNVSDGTTIGLLAYGHRSEGACDDIEVLAGLGAATPADLIAKLNGLKPTGKTPIAGALQAAGETFATNDANNNVILISDGIETCNGDPCAVAAELAGAGVDTKVHAVGFDVDSAAREQLECIADKGNGSYYNASNASELKVALAEVVDVVEATPEPEPEPVAEPTSSQYFFDDFDTDLGEDWAINNANEDAYLVEDGSLLMINSAVGGFGVEAAQNIVVLKRPLPDGDWDANMVFTGEIKTGRDVIMFGLYTDSQNFLTSQVYTSIGCCNCSSAGLGNLKSSKGVLTQFNVPFIGSQFGCGAMEEGPFRAELAENETQPIRLSLHKRGRSYHVSAFRGDKTETGEPIVFTTDPLTSLRSPGELAFTIGKYEQAEGEIMLMIDSVEIVSVNE
ncbi:hypothetical protein NBRC116588_30430 [Pyruvatibacter sp. HU-CL02332]|uniref:vWA domain-containing protein n=1 Tax=Pyruvatibacter sp. HU-CL02332 TaxID=3127650 RepID=UPI0031079D6F